MKCFLALATLVASVSAYGTVVNPNGPFPDTTESGQYGTNNCGTKDSPSANCQTLRINSIEDFCLWAPPKVASIGDSERYQVSWCTANGHGSRLMPKGALTGVHWIETPNFIQITGTGDFTKMNVPKGDEGGELDPHGADGNGNPIGALVIVTFDGKLTQATEWHEFISDNEFCIRVCKPASDAYAWCQHIYDVMGCYWNDPGNYDTGSFDVCAANSPELPPGEYYKNGGVSTWYQGVNPTPDAHPAGKSSKCSAAKSPGGAAYSGTKTTTTSKPTATGAVCSKTADCSQTIPGYSHRYCGSGHCTFRCNTGYSLNAAGNGCQKATTGGSTTTCSKTADCDNTPPAYGHRYCDKGKCSFRCNSGYKFNSGNTGCVKA